MGMLLWPRSLAEVARLTPSEPATGGRHIEMATRPISVLPVEEAMVA